MDGTMMSTGDLALLKNGDWGGNNNFLWIFALLILANGGFGMFGNRQGEFGQYATSASQQEILFGQHFQNLDNKLDRLGNGVADATYALTGNINAATSAVSGAVVNEGRAIQDKLCALRADVRAEGEATRALIQENKIESLQAQVSELKTQNMFCGVPRINPYAYGVYQYPQQQGCGCAYNAI